MVFDRERSQFDSKPRWKQVQLKKEKGLFWFIQDNIVISESRNGFARAALKKSRAFANSCSFVTSRDGKESLQLTSIEITELKCVAKGQFCIVTSYEP